MTESFQEIHDDFVFKYLPTDWTTERALGRWDIHHLIHQTCGFRSFVPFDLAFDEANARRLVAVHECE